MSEMPPTDLPPAPGPGLPQDPALAAAVLEIEQHVAASGWDQPAHLYALVPTAELVRQEPALAEALGLDDDASADGSLTPVEQDGLPVGRQLEEVLETVEWPDGVAGCAAVVERLVLPPEVDDQIPADPAEAAEFAREHPLRQEVRIVAGAMRTGASYCAMRMRSHDDDLSVVDGTDLVPGLLALLHQTLDVSPSGTDLSTQEP
ncbi:MAG: PPA1309 family protein [Nocardioides sp.]|uniref:PPA1309 family protein n=1 Tax=Nocardioides sp. TaxID=35761 RepID=UPI003F0742CF